MLSVTRASPGSATVSSGRALISRSVSSGSFRNSTCTVITSSAATISGTITFWLSRIVSGMDRIIAAQVGQVTR